MAYYFLGQAWSSRVVSKISLKKKAKKADINKQTPGMALAMAASSQGRLRASKRRGDDL
jgi:hypothetical protein